MKIACGTYVLSRKSPNKILTVHSKTKNVLGFPFGKKERHESFEMAAIRETKEETGIDVQIIQIKDPFWRVLKNEKGEESLSICFPAIAISDEDEIRSSEEGKAEWMDLNQFLDSKEFDQRYKMFNHHADEHLYREFQMYLINERQRVSDLQNF